MGEKIDILITGGTLLTMSKEMEIVENPTICIKDGRITRIEKNDGFKITLYSPKETIDASGSVIMPGLVNTHTHLPMVCFRGLADDLPLEDWLNNHIFPAESKHVNRNMVYDGSMLAIVEMILSGTTTFCDGYFYESSIARAAIDTGMRAVPSMGFSDLFTPDIHDQSSNIAAAEKFLKKWEGVSPLITPAFFCHSPYTCSPETLRAVKDVSREAGVLYLTHLSETKGETKTIQERYGDTPVRHLEKIGVLNEKTVAVHCNWPDEREIEILADYGVKVSHNPESSMKLAAGIAPISKMLKAGITVGLGTDGCASNNDLDMLREMDTAAKIHKIKSMNPTAMDAETVLKMATIEGAKLLGLEKHTGSIEEGKFADIIMIDMKKPHLTPVYNHYSHMVYAATGSDVSTSIINGKIVMKDRQLLTLNIREAMENVRKIARTIEAEQA